MPINFGGIDISGITTDGQQVVEVTMDGDVVWQLIQYESGEEVWRFEGFYDTVNSVAVDNDGYVYAGGRNSPNRSVIKIDQEGNEIWKIDNNGMINNILTDSNNDIYYTTQFAENLIKVDSNGNELWRDSPLERVDAIAMDNDGYIYLGHDGDEILKYDSNGNRVGIISFYDWPRHINLAIDSENYIYWGGDWPHYLQKMSQTGSAIWNFSIGDSVNDVFVDVNDFIYLAGDDGILRKLDKDGNEIWNYDNTQGISSVAVDNNGYVYIGGGWSRSVTKIDSNGNKVWEFNEPGYVYDVTVDTDGFVYSGCGDDLVIKIKT